MMIHPVDEHVGRVLKRVRKTRRLSQTDIAKMLGLSFQQIQKYEHGQNRISASRLYELSKVLGVSTSVFFADLESNTIAAAEYA